MNNYWLKRKAERESPPEIKVAWGHPITCTCTITVNYPTFVPTTPLYITDKIEFPSHIEIVGMSDPSHITISVPPCVEIPPGPMYISDKIEPWLLGDSIQFGKVNFPSMLEFGPVAVANLPPSTGI